MLAIFSGFSALRFEHAFQSVFVQSCGRYLFILAKDSRASEHSRVALAKMPRQFFERDTIFLHPDYIRSDMRRCPTSAAN
jgi:hypothetical protein